MAILSTPQRTPFFNIMANYAADSFELLRNRDRMLQQWKFENQLRREDEKRRKAQFLLASAVFEENLRKDGEHLQGQLPSRSGHSIANSGKLVVSRYFQGLLL